MTMTPDYHRIRDLAEACYRGVFLPHEGVKYISKLLLPENQIPVEELTSITPESSLERNLSDQLWRIEMCVKTLERRTTPLNKK